MKINIKPCKLLFSMLFIVIFLNSILALAENIQDNVCEDKDFYSSVNEFLSLKEFTDRANAIVELGKCKHNKTKDVLLLVLRSDPKSEIRILAAHLLKKFGSEMLFFELQQQYSAEKEKKVCDAIYEVLVLLNNQYNLNPMMNKESMLSNSYDSLKQYALQHADPEKVKITQRIIMYEEKEKLSDKLPLSKSPESIKSSPEKKRKNISSKLDKMLSKPLKKSKALNINKNGPKMIIAAAASGFGTHIMLSLADIAGSKENRPTIALGGVSMGGGTAFLLTRNANITFGDSLFWTNAGLLGWAEGAALSYALSEHLGERGKKWLTIGSEVAGIGLGTFLINKRDFKPKDFLYINFNSALATIFSTGLVYSLHNSKRGDYLTSYQSNYPLFYTGASLLGIGLGYSTVDKSFTPENISSTVLTSILIGSNAAILPFAMGMRGDEAKRAAAGGAMMGISGSYLIDFSFGLTHKLPAQRIKSAFLAGVLGNVFGFGLGTLVDPVNARQANLFSFASSLTLTSLALTDTLLGVRTSDLKVLKENRDTMPLSLLEGFTIGGAYGMSAVTAIKSDPDAKGKSERVLGAFTVGSLGGMYLGILKNRFTKDTPRTIKQRMGSALFGSFAGYGGALIASNSSDHHIVGAGLLTSIIGLSGWSSFAKLNNSYDKDIAGEEYLALTAGLYSIGLSMAVKNDYEVDSKTIGIGLLTTSAGFYTGSVLSAKLKLKKEDLQRSFLFGMHGFITGWGAALHFSKQKPSANLLLPGLGLGVLEMSLGLIMKPKSKTTSQERKLTAFSAIYGGSVGFAFEDYLNHYDENNDRTVWRKTGGAFLGLGLGSAMGYSLAKNMDISDLDIKKLTISTTVGSYIGYGLGMYPTSSNSRIPKLTMFGGSLTGLLLGSTLPNIVDYSTKYFHAHLFGTLYGAWYGLWIPQANKDGIVDSRKQNASMIVGSGTGYLLSSMLAKKHNLTKSDTKVLTLATLLGTSMGGGLALTLDNIDGLAGKALVLGGGTMFLGAAARKIKEINYSKENKILSTFFAGYGALHGLSLAYGYDLKDEQVLGAFLLGSSAGATLGLASGLSDSWTNTHTVILGAGTAWGNWIGGWFGYLYGGDNRKSVLTGTSFGGDVGLVITRLLLIDKLGFEPIDFGWIGLGGLIGMGSGSAVSAAVGQNITYGNIMGSSLGLIVGGIYAGMRDKKDSKSSSFYKHKKTVSKLSYKSINRSKSDLDILEEAGSQQNTSFKISWWFPSFQVYPDPHTNDMNYMLTVNGMWD